MPGRCPKTVSGSSVLLWLRTDLPRERAGAYWAGPHSRLVARTPGLLEYRRHHFAAAGPGLWPALDGVQTAIPDERRIDGMPEATFEHAWSPLLSVRHNRLVRADERNVFRRTVRYATAPGGGRWFHTGDGESVGARTVILLRRRPGVPASAFRRLVDDLLGPALDAAGDTLELRTQTFRSWTGPPCGAPGVAHDNPPQARFHASIVLGAANADALHTILASPSVEAIRRPLAAGCTAIHAYTVADTHVLRRDGRPTSPASKPGRKPRLEPVRRVVPPAPARARQARGTEPFPIARLIPLGGHGPEDVAVDAQGRLLCGIEGGRILRVDPADATEETVGDTGGRPLGLEVLPDGRLLVCDAHKGLLRVDPRRGEVETLTADVAGVPLRFCSNATATADGTVYFTESTSRYDFEHYLGALLEHRPSGRLLRRTPDGRVDVLLSGLHFANGIALTHDEGAVIFAETGAYRLSRLTLTGPHAGRVEVLADNLPGFPDNLSPLRDGRLWVALTNPRDRVLDRLATAPGLLRKALWRVPDRLMPSGRRTTWAMAFDVDGTVLADLQDDRADFDMATGAAEHDGHLYLASPRHNALLDLDLATRRPAGPRRR
ncbi:SMP-30/gluconolactonase/LRE family protein [Embleya sp. AB8]|uniref:SMP-30/gluconolactonase/LRE family protein n=1 Tax=Embleya sp. AB8 TaxID=3156304 RepID=UPI003C795264